MIERLADQRQLCGIQLRQAHRNRMRSQRGGDKRRNGEGACPFRLVLSAAIQTWRYVNSVPQTIRSIVMAGPMAKNRKKAEPFDMQEFLSSAGTSRSIAKFKRGQVIFSQDDPCDDVLYIQSGNAKLSIVNTQGKEAVLAIVGPGDFLGEGCIIGNPVRMATATAMAPLNAMIIDKKEMKFRY
jgi:CRP-like cAMP-binding protein